MHWNDKRLHKWLLTSTRRVQIISVSWLWQKCIGDVPDVMMSAARMVAGFTLVPAQPGFSRCEPGGEARVMRGLRVTQNCTPGRQRESQKLGGKKGGKFFLSISFLAQKRSAEGGKGLCRGRIKSWGHARSPCKVGLQTGGFESGSN